MPKRRLVILIDMDNTIADFDGEFYRRWIGTEIGREIAIHPDNRKKFFLYDDYPPELRKDIEEVFYAKGFFASLPPIPGALEAMEDLRKSGHCVRICTAVAIGHVHCAKEKYLWVQKNLGNVFRDEMIFSSDKTMIGGDYLIDDNPSINGLYKPTWEHVVVDRPYNKSFNFSKRLMADWSNYKEVLLRQDNFFVVLSDSNNGQERVLAGGLSKTSAVELAKKSGRQNLIAHVKEAATGEVIFTGSKI